MPNRNGVGVQRALPRVPARSIGAGKLFFRSGQVKESAGSTQALPLDRREQLSFSPQSTPPICGWDG
jgi:hypothetical protein